MNDNIVPMEFPYINEQYEHFSMQKLLSFTSLAVTLQTHNIQYIAEQLNSKCEMNENERYEWVQCNIEWKNDAMEKYNTEKTINTYKTVQLLCLL